MKNSASTILLSVAVALVLAPYSLYELIRNDVGTRSIDVSIEATGLQESEALELSLYRLRLQNQYAEFANRLGPLSWREGTGLTRRIVLTGPREALQRIDSIRVSLGRRSFEVPVSPDLIEEADDFDAQGQIAVPGGVALETLPIPRVGDLINVRYSLIFSVIALLSLLTLLTGFVAPREAFNGLLVLSAFGAATVGYGASLLLFPTTLWLLVVYVAVGVGITAGSSRFAGTVSSPRGPYLGQLVSSDKGVTVILVAAILVSTGLLLWNLGERAMWTDEFFSYYAARMIQDTGEPVFPTGLFYARARVYHYLLAGSMSLFGNTALGGRAVNLFFHAATMVGLFMVFRRQGRLLALSITTAWGLSTITLEAARLVRMYSMFTALFLFAAYAFYRALLEPGGSKLVIRIPIVSQKIHLGWLAGFITLFLLSLDTHNLTIMLVFGLAVFGLWRVVADYRDGLGWLVLAGAMTVLFVGAYFKFGTLNIVAAYYELSTPFHAQGAPFRPWHYTDLFVRSLPLALWALYVVPFWVLRGRPLLVQYTSAILLGGLLFLIPQDFRASRFGYALAPFVISLGLWAAFVAWDAFSEPSARRRIGFVLLALLAVLHVGHFAVAHRAVVAASDRQRFDLVFDYLQGHHEQDTTLVADWDTVFTLATRDIIADYILLPKSNPRVEEGHDADPYLGIPIIVLGGPEYSELLRIKSTLFVATRDATRERLAEDARELPGFFDPRVFRSHPTP